MASWRGLQRGGHTGGATTEAWVNPGDGVTSRGATGAARWRWQHARGERDAELGEARLGLVAAKEPPGPEARALLAGELVVAVERLFREDTVTRELRGSSRARLVEKAILSATPEMTVKVFDGLDVSVTWKPRSGSPKEWKVRVTEADSIGTALRQLDQNAAEVALWPQVCIALKQRLRGN